MVPQPRVGKALLRRFAIAGDKRARHREAKRVPLGRIFTDRISSRHIQARVWQFRVLHFLGFVKSDAA